MTELVLTPASPEEVRMLNTSICRLDRLLRASQTFAPEVVNPPRKGSSIALAFEAKERDAFDIANRLLFSAEDHLRVMSRIVKSGELPCYALFSLLRVAAEAIVRAHYLLDPALTREQRLARALNERVANLDAQQRILSDRESEARSLGSGDRADVARMRAELAESRARILARANHLGIKPILARTKTDVVHSYGEPSKTVAALFEQAFPAGLGLTIYRLLSGHVHSMQWAQLRPSRAKPSKDPDVSLVSTEVDITHFIAPLECLMDIYDQTLGWWCQLAGQPSEVWLSARQGAGPG